MLIFPRRDVKQLNLLEILKYILFDFSEMKEIFGEDFTEGLTGC